MSRAERRPVIVTEGVTVEISASTVSVSGPKGRLEQTFGNGVLFTLDGKELSLKATDDSRQSRAMVGTARAIISNMITGVVSGFSKRLEIAGVGFKAILKNGNALDLSLGTSHPILYPLPNGIHVTIADGVKLTVEGIDRQKVGQVAADVFAFCPAEPYKGKGVSIVGKFVRRKEGKKTA
ncbi:MAG: 50S ribosomal protein L6 [Puniceicoccales bacterium]|jgi:large subunit ribosomal protein L6|nr:50S ribosomal protein L6 [Puniceicoccales bacterium]